MGLATLPGKLAEARRLATRLLRQPAIAANLASDGYPLLALRVCALADWRN